MKSISLSMVLVMSVLIIFAPLARATRPVPTPTSDYQRGCEAGRKAAAEDLQISRSFIEVIWGFLFGPFAIAHAVCCGGCIPRHRLNQIEGKSSDYQRGFKEAYTTRVKGSTLITRVGGFAAWLATWSVAFTCER